MGTDADEGGNKPAERYLVPGVQEHDIILAEVILGELRHLGNDEAARLIGALKEAGLVVRLHLLQSTNRGKE